VKGQGVRNRVPDPRRPVYVISVAAGILRVHPRTLRIYEGEGLLCPARTPTNIRLYSDDDIRRALWIRHLTQNLGVNLAGIRILFELEEKLQMPILEALYEEPPPSGDEDPPDSTQDHQDPGGAPPGLPPSPPRRR
jgi:MerR family transcriptional regulator/heat shock protein HspR